MSGLGGLGSEGVLVGEALMAGFVTEAAIFLMISFTASPPSAFWPGVCHLVTRQNIGPSVISAAAIHSSTALTGHRTDPGNSGTAIGDGDGQHNESIFF